ncbi:MAG: histidinol-phosphate aminotransferase [Ulvibacter sp.]|jgi:histidinol-phosphate aminotransferase
MQNKMIFLDRNENNYGPAPKCYDVLKNLEFSKFSCYTREFQKESKGILSARFAKDFNLPENRVLLGYGAEDILKQTVQCYLEKGDKLMIPSFSWWYYKKLAEEVDGIDVQYPMIKGKDSFYYDLDEMIAIYKREKPKMVLISSPTNPTGNSLSITDINIVLKEFRDSFVILDEAYAHSGNNNYINELLDENPNLIIVRTFSKYYALAGVRVGYAFLGKNLTNLSKFTNRYLGYHRLSEEIALAALDSPEYYANMARIMNQDKELFYKAFNAIDGFTVFKSDTNFVLVEVPIEIMKSMQEFLLSRNLQIKFMNEELLNSHLRITIGTQEQNRMLVEAIEEFMSKQ